MDKKHGKIDNFKIVADRIVNEIKQQSLADAFFDSLDNRKTDKTTLRTPLDLKYFYIEIGKKHKCKVSTAMIKALRVVKDAVESGKMKFPAE